MKRTLRLVGMAAMVLLLAASCKKEGKENGGKQMMTFSAGIEQNDGTKTGLTPQGYPNPQGDQTARYWKQFWVAGDKINVNGDEFTLESGAGEQTATFRGETSPLEKPTEAYYAIYPVSSDATLSGTTATFKFPKTQYLKYKVVGNDTIYTADFAPMAAKCAKGAEVLQFKNLCTLFELRLYSTSNLTCEVHHVVLRTGNSATINGSYTYDFGDESTIVPTGASDKTSNVTLNCVIDGEKLRISNDASKPTSLLFVLPAGVNLGDKGLNFTVYNDEDEISSTTLYVTVPMITNSNNVTTTIAGEVLYNKVPQELKPDFAIGIISATSDVQTCSFKIKATNTNNNYIHLTKKGVVVYPNNIDCPPYNFEDEDPEANPCFHAFTGDESDLYGSGLTESVDLTGGSYKCRAYAIYEYKRGEKMIYISGITSEQSGIEGDKGLIEITVADE